jgi:tetratricopeptide (TPR) repeat protein
MGAKYKQEYKSELRRLEAHIASNPGDANALLSHAETNVVLFIFGLSSRDATIPAAHRYHEKARMIDSVSCKFHTVDGMLKFLDWDWEGTGKAFRAAIEADPEDPLSRHWYSLYISTMTGDYTEPMAQSDTIMMLDPSGDFKVGRGSLLYFARRNEELRDLMLETIEDDPSIPWGYDWLGMAYCELEDWDNSIETYFKAFELADGLVEVGGGLGHALGLAGEYDLAKQIADHYSQAAQDHYLPQVQRAFVHIGIGEYDEALRLLEEAYEARSWFVIFIGIEPWYDPIREDERFQELIDKMEYPETI